MAMPVDEIMCHRHKDWGFHCEQLGKSEAPRCTVFLRNYRVETTLALFDQNGDAKKKKKLARSLSMA
jgi:hypothetical protein